MHCVDLGEGFPTSFDLQNLASIQPRTSLVKFARSPRAQIAQVAACEEDDAAMLKHLEIAVVCQEAEESYTHHATLAFISG